MDMFGMAEPLQMFIHILKAQIILRYKILPNHKKKHASPNFCDPG